MSSLILRKKPLEMGLTLNSNFMTFLCPSQRLEASSGVYFSSSSSHGSNIIFKPEVLKA